MAFFPPTISTSHGDKLPEGGTVEQTILQIVSKIPGYMDQIFHRLSQLEEENQELKLTHGNLRSTTRRIETLNEKIHKLSQDNLETANQMKNWIEFLRTDRLIRNKPTPQVVILLPPKPQPRSAEADRAAHL